MLETRTGEELEEYLIGWLNRKSKAIVSVIEAKERVKHASTRIKWAMDEIERRRNQ